MVHTGREPGRGGGEGSVGSREEARTKITASDGARTNAGILELDTAARAGLKHRSRGARSSRNTGPPLYIM